MSTNSVIHQLLAVSLAVCLVLPGAALAGGKSGKKNFKEGVKYEQQQQWDMAAQQFALAVAAEPNNPEYKLHYLQALQKASMMYVKRGNELAEQGDLASAYTAYRTAYQYDQGNEIARMKMERMLEQQRAQATGADQGTINRVGNFKPTSTEIQTAAKPRSRDVVQSINFKDSKFKTIVTNLGKQLGLNVVFDESVKDQPISIDLTDVTVAKALDIIFKTYKYSFEQVDRRTILVYQDNPTNRPRFESLLIKTFYLGNITATQARTALQAMLPPGRQMATLDQGNTAGGNLLVVKATASELQLVQDVLDSLDKNKNEVVVDVEIYEISRDSSLQLGNQIGLPSSDGSSASGPTLGSLGGIGYNLAEGAARAGLSAFSIGPGALIGLPATSLSLLQSKGNNRLLYKTQIHALDGQKNVTKVGRSVPVRVGTTYPNGGIGGVVTTGQGATNNNPLNNLLGGGFGTVDNIQYRDVGLVIEAKPTITNEGYVEIEMKFETSDVVQSGATANLTPTFTQRSLNTTARIQDGVTSVVAGVNQETRGNSRAGIPFISMVPILGRFISTPNQTNSQSDIIITVTPHIIRSQGINKDDHLARYAGQTQAGPNQSVEEVVNRAQQQEEEERRLIAQGIPQTTPPLTTTAPAPTQAAGFNQPPRTAPQQTFQPVNNTNSPVVQRPVNNRSLDPTANTSVDVPVSNPIPSPPVTPEPQIENQENQNDGVSTGNNPSKKKEGEEEVQTVITPPAQPFEPTGLVMARRPENFEKELAKRRAEAQLAAKEAMAKDQPAPVQTQQEFVRQAPQQKAPVAVPRMTENSRVNSPVTFSLSPRPIRMQPGKTFTVAVEVSGQAQMTGATISLRFDHAKLKFKGVKDAGMFGAQPDLTYEVERGNLVVRVKQQQAAPVSGSGRLILVEFTALAEGQSEIAFNANATQIKMANNTLAQAGGAPTQVIVSRDGAISATNEK
jgi:general secretion pathway protein D